MVITVLLEAGDGHSLANLGRRRMSYETASRLLQAPGVLIGVAALINDLRR